jgi:hypothetical protein
MTTPTDVYYVERIPATDPRLKRQIRHDPRSRRFVFDTSGVTIATVEHKRTLPILDQGNVGKCTAEAGLGILGTEPYACDAVTTAFSKAFGGFDDKGTDRLYNAEEAIDGDGPYPPNDNGSSGLTLAKALRAAGAISGWTQVFSLDALLKALQSYPVAVGTYWYQSMMRPGRDGVVKVDFTSGVAGGHEYECVGYDTSTGLLKFANSWGTGWGAAGYFYIDATVFGKLLAKRGDATIFTPISQPAPTPTPTPSTDPDRQLLANLGPWMAAPHSGLNATAVGYVKDWAKAQGLL